MAELNESEINFILETLDDCFYYFNSIVEGDIVDSETAEEMIEKVRYSAEILDAKLSEEE